MLKNLSSHLFWDVKIDSLDIKRDKKLIIERIIEYGYEKDEVMLYKLFSKRAIKNVFKNMDFLGSNSIEYYCMVLNIKREKLKCYGKKPLHIIY